eukprot:6493150-Prymnesium_polylepis.1
MRANRAVTHQRAHTYLRRDGAKGGERALLNEAAWAALRVARTGARGLGAVTRAQSARAPRGGASGSATSAHRAAIDPRART